MTSSGAILSRTFGPVPPDLRMYVPNTFALRVYIGFPPFFDAGLSPPRTRCLLATAPQSSTRRRLLQLLGAFRSAGGAGEEL